MLGGSSPLDHPVVVVGQLDDAEALAADEARQALQLQQAVQAEGLTYKGMFVLYLLRTLLQTIERKFMHHSILK